MVSNYLNCNSINRRFSWWFLLSKKIYDGLFEKNPPINEEMLRMMMMQMGQKPSQKKINQMMTMMNKNMDQGMKGQKK